MLSYLIPDGTGTRLDYVTLTSTGWSDPVTVARGERWFVNWADFPSVVPVSERLWAAHWLVRSASGPYAYDAMVSVSEDGGRTWTAGRKLHDDDTPTEHGFVSLYPTADGVGAVWLDGRALAGAQAGGPGAMMLRGTVVRAADPVESPSVVVDDRVCDCCQTDVALSAEGPLLVYRDRSPDEIRDIAISRLRNGVWAPGRIVARDGWQISGCPVNGPAIAAEGKRVVTAWYTAEPDRRVRVAFSTDAGDTFGRPLDVSDGAPLGRVDVVLIDGETAVVSWLDAVPGSLKIRRVGVDGRLGPIREVATLSPQRDAGFPQMIRDRDRLVFAWTDVDAGRVRMRMMPVP